MDIKYFLNNPIYHRLSHSDRNQRLRRAGLFAGIIALLMLLLSMYMLLSNLIHLPQRFNLTLIILFFVFSLSGWAFFSVLGGFLSTNMRKLIKQDKEQQPLDLVKTTPLSVRRIILGYGLAILYRNRILIAIILGLHPAMLTLGIVLYSGMLINGMFQVRLIGIAVIISATLLSSWGAIFPMFVLSGWHQLMGQESDRPILQWIKDRLLPLPFSIGLTILNISRLILLFISAVNVEQIPSIGRVIVTPFAIAILMLFLMLAGIGLGFAMFPLAEKRLR